jgi:hypothetical protein
MIRPAAVTDRTGLTQALRALKLSGMLATLDARLAQAAAGDLGHPDFSRFYAKTRTPAGPRAASPEHRHRRRDRPARRCRRPGCARRRLALPAAAPTPTCSYFDTHRLPASFVPVTYSLTARTEIRQPGRHRILDQRLQSDADYGQDGASQLRKRGLSVSRERHMQWPLRAFWVSRPPMTWVGDGHRLELVVEADVAVGYRHSEGGAPVGEPAHRCGELPHHRGVFGRAEVQAVRHGQRVPVAATFR